MPIGSGFLGSVVHGKGKHFKVVKSVVHPEYDVKAFVNDLGLIFLSDKGAFYPEGGSKLTVAGFGLTTADGPISPALLKVQVTIGDKDACAANKNFRGLVFDPKAQVCATDNGYSACNGDSGGPLYTGSGNDVQVVGLVSGAGKYGARCGEKGSYQYYTFIEAFTPWIKSEIEKFEKNGANSTAEIETD
ncbi:hypothetical protein BGZ68_004001 [Mortierella alpina]|nr:hypothetical protein BGZ68_004001 [Mortierella alpina]